MTKKKSRKRPNLSQATLDRARTELRSASRPEVIIPEANVSAAKSKRPNTSLASRHIPTTEELLKEYAYVFKELRTVLILAAILLTGIVVAAIIFRL